MHWSLEDQSLLSGTRRATMPVFRAVAGDLEARIGFLIVLIDNESSREYTSHG